jgi:hypothetical protein
MTGLMWLLVWLIPVVVLVAGPVVGGLSCIAVVFIIFALANRSA